MTISGLPPDDRIRYNPESFMLQIYNKIGFIAEMRCNMDQAGHFQFYELDFCFNGSGQLKNCRTRNQPNYSMPKQGANQKKKGSNTRTKSPPPPRPRPPPRPPAFHTGECYRNGPVRFPAPVAAPLPPPAHRPPPPKPTPPIGKHQPPPPPPPPPPPTKATYAQIVRKGKNYPQPPPPPPPPPTKATYAQIVRKVKNYPQPPPPPPPPMRPFISSYAPNTKSGQGWQIILHLSWLLIFSVVIKICSGRFFFGVEQTLLTRSGKRTTSGRRLASLVIGNKEA